MSTNLLAPAALGKIIEPGLSAAYSLLLTQLESHALEPEKPSKQSMFDFAHYAQGEARLGRWRQEGTESLLRDEALTSHPCPHGAPHQVPAPGPSEALSEFHTTLSPTGAGALDFFFLPYLPWTLLHT